MKASFELLIADPGQDLQQGRQWCIGSKGRNVHVNSVICLPGGNKYENKYPADSTDNASAIRRVTAIRSHRKFSNDFLAVSPRNWPVLQVQSLISGTVAWTNMRTRLVLGFRNRTK